MSGYKNDKKAVKELIKILEQDGWYEARQTGGHKQFKHPKKRGLVTVSIQGLNKNLWLSALRQAGLRKGYNNYEDKSSKDKRENC